MDFKISQYKCNQSEARLSILDSTQRFYFVTHWGNFSQKTSGDLLWHVINFDVQNMTT